jgi:NADH:ubiquinone oxidoreductase subunit E
MFSPTPRGRHLVRICTSGSCFLNGAQKIRDAVCESLGVEIGGTTSDGEFTVELCQCLGTCDQSPAAMVDLTTRGPLTPRGALALIEESIAEENEE